MFAARNLRSCTSLSLLRLPVRHLSTAATAKSSSSMPVLHYFPIKGRAEPIRLILAYKQQSWHEPPFEPIFESMVKDISGYPFRQVPRFVDEEDGVDIVQSMAIVRHLGRKYDLYGKTLADKAKIDMLIDGAEDLRSKIRDAWYVKKLTPEAKQHYISTALLPEEKLIESSERGIGLACFEKILKERIAAGESWFVGGAFSIADVVIANQMDLHMNAFADEVKTFPQLVDHYYRVHDLPGIKEYMQSERRSKMMWGSDYFAAKAAAQGA